MKRLISLLFVVVLPLVAKADEDLNLDLDESSPTANEAPKLEASVNLDGDTKTQANAADDNLSLDADEPVKDVQAKKASDDLELDGDDAPSRSQASTPDSPKGDIDEFAEFQDAPQPPVEAQTPIAIDEPAPPTAPVVPETVPPVQAEAPIEPTPKTESTLAARSDAPNSALEKRLHDIFVKYQQKQIADSEWMGIVGEKKTEKYSVQPGNTLWDISQTFFGDANFWPKVWSMNHGITNPHAITPGLQIMFTPGDVDEAPRLAFADAGQAPEGAAAEVDIPPPSKVYAPVLSELPSSLPMSNTSVNNRQYDDLGFNGAFRDVPHMVRRTAVIEQAVDQAPESSAQIIEISGGGIKTAATYQYLFIKSQKPLQVGDRFISFHMKDGAKPLVVQYEAELSITEVVDSKDNIYQALITRAFDAVRVGSMVLHAQMVMVEPESSGNLSKVRANVIGAQYDAARRVTSPGELLFLDKGSAEGVHVDDGFTIVINHKIRDNESMVKNLGQAVGLVRVVNVASHTSTALVLKSDNAIYIGDTTAAKDVYFSKSKLDLNASEITLDLGQSSDPDTLLDDDTAGASAEKPADDSSAGSDIDLDI